MGEQDLQINSIDITLEISDEYVYFTRLIHNTGSFIPKINKRIILA